MKTSNILIAAAILGAGYLYKKRKDDTAPVAVVVPTETTTGGVLANTGVVGPGYTTLDSGVVAVTQTGTFNNIPKTAIGQKIVIVDKKDLGKVHLGAYNAMQRQPIQQVISSFNSTPPFA